LDQGYQGIQLGLLIGNRPLFGFKIGHLLKSHLLDNLVKLGLFSLDLVFKVLLSGGLVILERL
jgi:hypothetical protein